MRGKAHLLLGDVELLDVENHLLLKTVLIYLHAELCNTLADTSAHSICACSLKRSYGIAICLNLCYAVKQVCYKGVTLLCAEGIELLCCELYRLDNRCNLLIRYGLALGRKDIRHTKHSRHDSIVGSIYARKAERICHLMQVCAEDILVNHATCLHRLALVSNNHIHLTTNKSLRYDTAHLKLCCTIRHRHLYREVQLL